jgi:hypothetical protein
MPRSEDGRWTRACEICGDEFQQKRPGQRTCSVACRAKLPHNTGGVRVKAGLDPRQCQNPECGKTYQPVRESQTSCSRACLLKTPQYIEAQRRTERRPERHAARNQRRKMETTKDPDLQRFLNLRGNLRYLYGLDLTLAEYQEWRARQNGHCKICGREVSGKSAHTDHDHATGKLRDELCDTCNRGLGNFKDDPSLLRVAAEYIERHRSVS